MVAWNWHRTPTRPPCPAGATSTGWTGTSTGSTGWPPGPPARTCSRPCCRTEPRSLLDLGCGDGRLAALALEARPSLRRVVAVDNSPAMLERARHRFAGDRRVSVRAVGPRPVDRAAGHVRRDRVRVRHPSSGRRSEAQPVRRGRPSSGSRGVVRQPRGGGLGHPRAARRVPGPDRPPRGRPRGPPGRGGTAAGVDAATPAWARSTACGGGGDSPSWWVAARRSEMAVAVAPDPGRARRAAVAVPPPAHCQSGGLVHAGGTTPSSAPSAWTGPSSCPSGTRPATGATSWPTSRSRTRPVPRP